jgi:hypothetical protein
MVLFQSKRETSLKRNLRLWMRQATEQKQEGIRMKLNYVEFGCDRCGDRVVVPPNQSEVLPYNRGWVYLYENNFKTRKDQIVQMKDKHFCSIECMTNYLQSLIRTASGNDSSECIGLFKNQKD